MRNGSDFRSPDYGNGPAEMVLFVTFVDNLNVARREKISQDAFLRELENHDMRFEFLKDSVVLPSGADMTGIVRSVSHPAMSSLIRENFVSMVKSL